MHIVIRFLQKKLLLEYTTLQNKKSIYRSFIGWNSNFFNSKNTNVRGKYLKRLSLGEEIENSSWFFGGSTMWGQGATDFGTIPSQFYKLTGQKVYNFGELGWNSRQSINQSYFNRS